jgi:hypothetical protein
MKNFSGSGWVGDFLLLINSEIEPVSARLGTTWQLSFSTHNARLYFTHPNAFWRGCQIQTWSKGERIFWLLGSIWGEKDGDDPSNWPGHFLLISFQGKNNSWHIQTNRSGTFHAYFAETRQGTAISSYSIAASIVTDKLLDIEAISGFFSLGFFPAFRTYIKDLQIIPASTEMVFDESGREIKKNRLWSWYHLPQKEFTFDQAVDKFADLFHQIINEQIIDRKVAFPISGGLDSRCTIAALQHIKDNPDIWTYSYGYSDDSIETKIAKQIATTARLPFTSYTIQPYLFEKIDHVMDCVEGFQDVTQTRQAFIFQEFSARVNYVIAAHLGDLWLDNMINETKSLQCMDEIAYHKLLRPGGALLKEIVFKDTNLIKSNPDFLKDVLQTELEPLKSIQDPDFRLKALKTKTYVFRLSLASLRMYQPGAFPLLPFFDPRMFDFFCRLPTAYVAGRRLQIEYIKRYAPNLAQIRWQPYDANLFNYQHFHTWHLPKRVFKKVWRLLSRKQIIQRNWEVQFLNPQGRENLENWLLSPGMKLHNYAEKRRLEKFLADFYARPDAANGYAVSMLLTFSAWLEKYG